MIHLFLVLTIYIQFAMKRFSLILTLILTGYCALAQTSHNGLMHDELFDRSDSLTASDYMMSIERVNDKLNAIRDSATLEFEFEAVKRRVDNMTDDISLIRNNIRGRNTVVNIRNLYLYQSFASNLKTENLKLQRHVTETFNRVYTAKMV